MEYVLELDYDLMADLSTDNYPPVYVSYVLITVYRSVQRRLKIPGIVEDIGLLLAKRIPSSLLQSEYSLEGRDTHGIDVCNDRPTLEANLRTMLERKDRTVLRIVEKHISRDILASSIQSRGYNILVDSTVQGLVGMAVPQRSAVQWDGVIRGYYQLSTVLSPSQAYNVLHSALTKLIQNSDGQDNHNLISRAAMKVNVERILERLNGVRLSGGSG